MIKNVASHLCPFVFTLIQLLSHLLLETTAYILVRLLIGPSNFLSKTPTCLIILTTNKELLLPCLKNSSLVNDQSKPKYWINASMCSLSLWLKVIYRSPRYFWLRWSIPFLGAIMYIFTVSYIRNLHLVWLLVFNIKFLVPETNSILLWKFWASTSDLPMLGHYITIRIWVLFTILVCQLRSLFVGGLIVG